MHRSLSIARATWIKISTPWDVFFDVCQGTTNCSELIFSDPPLYVISRRNDAESGRGIKSKGEGWNRGRRARDNGGYGSGTPLRSHFRIRATQSDEKARRRENVRWILNALAVDVPEEPREGKLLISGDVLSSPYTSKTKGPFFLVSPRISFCHVLG